MGAVNLFSPTRNSLWNPQEQFTLDPATGQYAQQPVPTVQPLPQPQFPDLGRDPGTPSGTATPWGGWNINNIFDYEAINEQAKQGLFDLSRDEIANQRDIFGKSLEDSFRQAMLGQGQRIDETSATVFNDPTFRTFVTSGQLPAALPAAGPWAQVGSALGSLFGGSSAPPITPSLFDDPSTQQLETVAKTQMNEVRDNPGLRKLLEFLDSQFANLSQSPGFSPEEMAVLNTQALEPIEDLRKASTERSLQRTANRGFLPSSGLAELDLRQIDRDADRMRTQANRDLSINAIDRRDADLARAMSYATTRGLTIPQGQRAEELNLSNLLYQLPSNALKDLLAVLQGSPGAPNLLQGAQASAYQQQIQQAQTAEMWRQIAALIGSMNF